jgi:LacI family transcriptional regulator
LAVQRGEGQVGEGARIRDVAKAAGVSPATVSRVLNNSAGVGEALRKRVLGAVERLQYRPNPHARALLSGRSHTAGLLVAEVDGPFYGPLYRGLERVLSEHRLHLIMASGRRRHEVEWEVVNSLLGRGLDLLFLWPEALSQEELRWAAAQGPKVVILGQEVPGLPCVALDHAHGGYLATRYLLQAGHLRIAHVAGPQGMQDAVSRLAGYQRALAERGLEVDPELVAYGNFRESGGYRAARELLSRGRPFSALFAANDQMAIGVAAALEEAGLRVPQDVSLMGYDDIIMARYVRPALTTIRQPLEEVGKAAALRALQALGYAAGTPQELALEVIERSSVRPLDSS